jgi:hypothetical protein
MKMPELEIADVFHQFEDQLKGLLPNQHKVVQAIKNCRTKVLGEHKIECDGCDYQKISYNSCSNRHCPKCGFLTKVKWVEKRKADLLPCQYFHVVFTIPSDLRELFLRNKEICYKLLFKTTSETLKEVAQNPKNLGAEIGFTGVLHTWGQNLVDHPHIHYIIPGGGLNKKKTKWIACPKDYFLPVKILSKVFRGKLLNGLRKIYDRDEFKLIGRIEYLSSSVMFDELLLKLAAKNWCVYSKKPFAGPEQVVEYLGQYTHRIAISNYRLVKIENEKVFFKVRDNENQGKSKIISLHVKEFMRRFLLHVLPSGFMRMRHFGFLGNRYRKENIALIRKIKNIVEKLVTTIDQSWQDLLKSVTGIDVNKCPDCVNGKLSSVAKFRLINTS